jgi:hypothetical protein
MEYKELPATCTICDAALVSPSYRFKSVRYEGLNIRADFHYHFCAGCYAPVYTAVKKAVHARMKQRFQDVLAHFKRDLASAVKDRVTTVRL